MRPLSEKEIEILAEKKLLGTISPEESRLLEDWLRQPSGESMLWFGDDEKTLRARILHRIRLDAGIINAHVSVWYRYKWAAAAILLLAMVTGGYFIYFSQEQTTPKVMAIKDIPPGKNGAVLTFEDGHQFVLEGTADAVNLGKVSGSKITQQNDQLVFQQDSIAAGMTPSDNRLSTARGRQYRIVLPDGTKVWLNAASELRFPSAFTGHERRVKLDGEAYFEVAKNPQHPFIVMTDRADVTVLGTHFAMAAYKDENKCTTTLSEGSVSVASLHSKAVIHPGQQASINKSGLIQVQSVDTTEAVAWVHGMLSLDVQDVPTLMRQIARWYDVDVHYKGTLPTINIIGMINRNVYLSELLQALRAYGIKAKLEGRTVVVN